MTNTNASTHVCISWQSSHARYPCWDGGSVRIVLIVFVDIDLDKTFLVFACSAVLLRWQTKCFLQILCDLLSPADENVKVGLRETTQNTSPHLRSKTLVSDAQAPPQNLVHRQHQVRAASAHHRPDSQEVLPHWIIILILQSLLVDSWSHCL